MISKTDPKSNLSSSSRLVNAWHSALCAIALLNSAVWLVLASQPRWLGFAHVDATQLWLSFFYVFGCAFRSVLPRAGERRFVVFCWLIRTISTAQTTI